MVIANLPGKIADGFPFGLTADFLGKYNVTGISGGAISIIVFKRGHLQGVIFFVAFGQFYFHFCFYKRISLFYMRIQVITCMNFKFYNNFFFTIFFINYTCSYTYRVAMRRFFRNNIIYGLTFFL